MITIKKVDIFYLKPSLRIDSLEARQEVARKERIFMGKISKLLLSQTIINITIFENFFSYTQKNGLLPCHLSEMTCTSQ